ncbi:MAG TPA: FtsX-like permease family protein [Bryobacteraceae bacterium]
MTGKIVFENLKHRPMRTLLSALLIAVPVTLILTLVGLTRGMLEDSERRARGIGADVWVRPPGTAFATSLSGAPIPEKMVDFLQQQPHVRLALGTVVQATEGVTFGVTGVDFDRFTQMSGGFQFVEGGPPRAPNDIIVDQYYAGQKELHVGSTFMMLGNRTWRVSGIFTGGKLARIILPLRIVQELTSSSGKVTQIFVKLDDPKNTDIVIAQLKMKLPDYPMYSMEDLSSLYNVSSYAGLNEFITVIVGLGVVIGFFVVWLSMYMAVLQRTREIGILKSLGASNGFILRTIVAEGLLLGVGGTIIGIGLSFGSWWLIRTLVPASIQMVIVTSWWPIAGAITLVGAGLGALYPGWNAARHDPIEALAYE